MASMKVKINGTWQECGFGIEGSSPTPTPPTPDGKVHLIVDLSDSPSNRLTLEVAWWQSVSNGTVIDWGDGSTNTPTGSNISIMHTYAQAGRYDITIEATSGYIEFRTSVINNSIIAMATALKEAYLWGVATIGDGQAFRYCYALQKVVFDDNITQIGLQAFYACQSIRQVTVPSNVTTIGIDAFRNCSSVGEYHVLPTTPPTLGSSAFQGIQSDCKIYVPSASVETYKSASGWSTYASYIYGE